MIPARVQQTVKKAKGNDNYNSRHRNLNKTEQNREDNEMKCKKIIRKECVSVVWPKILSSYDFDIQSMRRGIMNAKGMKFSLVRID